MDRDKAIEQLRIRERLQEANQRGESFARVAGFAIGEDWANNSNQYGLLARLKAIGGGDLTPDDEREFGRGFVEAAKQIWEDIQDTL